VVFETHATSLDNEAGLASGWFDVDLSATGEAQARELGERRRDDVVAAVYCSDLRRAIRTADLAFGGRGVPIVHDARLRECDYGAFTRHPAREIDAQRADRIETPFPGGESYAQCVARVEAWLADVRAARPAGDVLVIGHRATLYALEHLLGGVPLQEAVVAPWSWQPGVGFRGSNSLAAVVVVRAIGLVEERQVGQIFRAAERVLVHQEIDFRQDADRVPGERHEDAPRPGLVERHAGDPGKNVDPSRRHAHLEDGVRPRQVVGCEIAQRRSEGRQRAQGANRVLRRRANPDVEIAGRARHAMSRERVRADDQEVNARL
jgi:broad specificity phosphatase PhoE